VVKWDGDRNKAGEDHSRQGEQCRRGPTVEVLWYFKCTERRPLGPDEAGSWVAGRPYGTSEATLTICSSS